jgi:hypothetical protein
MPQFVADARYMRVQAKTRMGEKLFTQKIWCDHAASSVSKSLVAMLSV